MTAVTNLVLVGPMGSGKTSVGKLLAKKLSLNFLDSDKELESRCGADIPWIFDIEGESGFRARETEILAELSTNSGILLATGGGAVTSEKNRQLIRGAGIVVYLSATADQIYQRVRHDFGRPLLQVDNPKVAIEDILKKREPLYREVADLVIPSSERETASSMAVAVCAKIEEHFPNKFLFFEEPRIEKADP
jgi:shikimate kinase